MLGGGGGCVWGNLSEVPSIGIFQINKGNFIFCIENGFLQFSHGIIMIFKKRLKYLCVWKQVLQEPDKMC